MKKTLAKKILSKLTTLDQDVQDTFDPFDVELSKLTGKLKETLAAKTLDEIKSGFSSIKDTIQPVLAAVTELKQEVAEREKNATKAFSDREGEIVGGIEKLIADFSNQSQESSSLSKESLDAFSEQLSSFKESIFSERTYSEERFAALRSTLATLEQEITTSIDTSIRDIEQKLSATSIADASFREMMQAEIGRLSNTFEESRLDILRKFGSLGGGNMNRKITFGGVDYLTRYTDINYKAGSNVIFTIVNNNQTKMVDVTIAATGGSGSGIVRVITSVSTNTAADAVAGTDYVYLCSGTMTITLPTAVGNTNLYTIKNVGTGVVTIAFTGGQTGDGSAILSMPVQYTSLDLISDTANFNIT